MRIAKIFAWISLSVAPFLFMVYQYKWLSDLPFYDYWHGNYIGSIFLSDNLINFLSGLLHRSNEHIIVVPKLFYHLNFLLFSGSNYGMYALNLILNCFTVLVFFLLIKEMKLCKQDLVIALPVLSFVFFSPTAGHNWFLAFSGNHWFMANLFFLTSLFFLIKFIKDYHIFNYFLSVFFVFMSVLTYSTGLMGLIAIAIVFLPVALNNRKSISYFCGYICFSVVVFSIIFITYTKPAHHPSFSIDVFVISNIIFSFIGNPFTNNHNYVLVIGKVGFLFLCIATIIFFKYAFIKHKIEDYTPLSIGWAVCLYSFLNALLAAISRGGFGNELYGMANRYMNLSVFFWLGLLLFFYCYIFNFIKINSRVYLYISKFVFIVIISMTLCIYYKHGLDISIRYETQARHSIYAKMALHLDIYDEEIENKFIFSSFTEPIRHILKSKSHVPFNENFFDKFELDHNIMLNTNAVEQDIKEYKYYIDRVVSLNDDWKRIQGWVVSLKNINLELNRLYAYNSSDNLIGIGAVNLLRDDVKKVFGFSNARYSGFIIYVNTNKLCDIMSIYIKADDKHNVFLTELILIDKL
ncbi:hypothetical protein [Desulfonatronovibrio magnus]|uniref:hypothetical protein n=1 Tax=Desulfonatronovibrio magnus TaxID=698827 RepID=UPI0005EAE376|nr:hypothetical protein [Desulfonatronovibrio magnus]